ncbi:hypothetical protein RND81_02G019500 [Saponaria officinalis]|uniref:Uncharacterized protein n=1 Tax=Saponaria officinalis TaxID=3572 RepID=A0AAW1MJY2_SAPOF
MQTFYKSSRIVCFSLIFIILMNTASSFPKGNDLYGWRLTKDEHGEWKFVALPGLSRRRSLKVGPPVTVRVQSSPNRAPENNHDHPFEGANPPPL